MSQLSKRILVAPYGYISVDRVRPFLVTVSVVVSGAGETDRPVTYFQTDLARETPEELDRDLKRVIGLGIMMLLSAAWREMAGALVHLIATRGNMAINPSDIDALDRYHDAWAKASLIMQNVPPRAIMDCAGIVGPEPVTAHAEQVEEMTQIQK